MSKAPTGETHGHCLCGAVEYAQGALQLAWVESLDPGRDGELQCLGVTLWITDHAVAALVRPGNLPAARRVYASETAGASEPSWVMTAAEIRAAHAEQCLNLLVLHFWTRRPPFEPEFQAVFVQSHTKFRDLHQGYGVRQLLQEVAPFEVDILRAAGLKIVRADAPDAAVPRVLLGLVREDALADPGSTLSFLFLSPKSHLDLRPSVQRMLSLALQQLTDDDIAQALACSRDYVRKLWDDAYEKLDAAGISKVGNATAPDSTAAPRGRERRRQALEFLRGNPQELRPGLADQGT